MTDGFIARGIELPCPRCGRLVTADVQIIADLEQSPELRSAAEAGQLNCLECPACHARFTAPTPLLFHEPSVPRALAYVPVHLDEDTDSIVSGLLARFVQASDEPMPGEYLLEPTIYHDPEEFHAALAGVAESDGPLHPDFDAAQTFVRRHGSERLARAMTALEEVADLPQLVAALNQTPDLVEPVVVREMEQLADGAEVTGEEAIAAQLRDIVAMLRLHTPALAQEESEDEPVPEDVRSRLAAADLEDAAEYLERPARESGDEAKRAMQNTLEPELREGFTEHAQLFGGLVESMMEHESDEEDEEEAPPAGEEEAPEGLDELIAAPTLDNAMEIIAARPALISRDAVSHLRRLEAVALDAGDDGMAQHLDMLINTIYIAAEDEDELEEGETGDELDGS